MKISGLNALVLALSIIVMIAVSSIAADYSYSEAFDRSDRFSSEQSRVFSPGYINAAKQKADAIISQSSRQKSFMENIAEYVKEKLSNKVNEDAVNEVRPELKKKAGGTGEMNEQKRDNPSVEMEFKPINNAVVEDALNEISSSRNVAKGYIKYEGLADGNILFAWTEGNKLCSQIYNDRGKFLNNNVISYNSPGDDYLIKALSDNKIVVGYYNNGVKFKIFNADGTVHRDEFSGGSTRLTGYDCGEKASITALSDGRFAVAWSMQGYDHYYYGDVDEGWGIGEVRLKSYFKIFNNDGSASKTMLLAAPVDPASRTNWNWDPRLATLANGNIVATWHASAGGNVTYFQILDSNGMAIDGMNTPKLLSSNSTQDAFVNPLSNGNFIMSWSDDRGWKSYAKMFDSSGKELSREHRIGLTSSGPQHSPTVTELSNGNFLVTYFVLGSSRGYYANIYDKNWKETTATIKLDGTVPKYMDDIMISAKALSNGTFNISWYSSDTGYGYNQFNSKGAILSRDQIAGMSAVSLDGGSNRQDIAFSNLLDAHRSVSAFEYYENYKSDNSGHALSASSVASIFKGLLEKKVMLPGDGSGHIDVVMAGDVVDDVLVRSALSADMYAAQNSGEQEMRVAMILSGIFKNPTEDQKMIIDAVTALLNEIAKQEEESGAPGLKKASDDLLQMVAAVLIAQAIPDLLKEGDMSDIKNIFSELNATKAKIVFGYQESLKPYYEEMKRLLSNNILILQLNNIVSKQMMKEELAKLEPNAVDKILEKIRRLEKKGFEEEYILQQEAKYKKEYIDPNRKLMEEKMKLMMKEFTRRISGVLENTKPVVKK